MVMADIWIMDGIQCMREVVRRDALQHSRPVSQLIGIVFSNEQCRIAAAMHQEARTWFFQTGTDIFFPRS